MHGVRVNDEVEEERTARRDRKNTEREGGKLEKSFEKSI